MSRLPDPLFVAGAQETLRTWTRLTPQADDHIAVSRRLILETAQQVARCGRALVLGAGHCAEIPLAELAEMFESVHLVDSDAEALAAGVAAAGLSAEAAERVSHEVADLTGVSESFLAAAEALLDSRPSFQQWHDKLLGLATYAEPQLFLPHGFDLAEPASRFDLVVASCVLCQLHVATAAGIAGLVAERFSDKESRALHDSQAWTNALEMFARRMEHAFVSSWMQLLSHGGRIYFSDTVQVCFVHGTSDGQWATQGTYRMTRTTDLVDYLADPFSAERLGEWMWVFQPPTKPGDIGRLYRVQGLRLQLRLGQSCCSN